MAGYGAEPGRKNPQWKDGRKAHPLYDIWAKMVSRCTRPSDPSYSNYGGRGITVCDEWLTDFFAFAGYVGERPEGRYPSGFPLYTLDRVDNNRGYEPGNVRWATIREQSLNRRTPARGDTCPRGHERTPENTWIRPSSGYPQCLLCTREWAKESKSRKQA